MKEEKTEITNPAFPIPTEDSKSIIERFLLKTKKLSLSDKQEEGKITVFQAYDKKTLSFKEEDIKKILERKEAKGEDFLQINFKNGKKILLTKEFVGFSPASCSDMDSKKLPRVVTTADLFSVIEAIEGSLYGTDQYQESLHDVRLFFEAIASGAESAGFDLTGERLWVERLFPKNPAA